MKSPSEGKTFRTLVIPVGLALKAVSRDQMNKPLPLSASKPLANVGKA